MQDHRQVIYHIQLAVHYAGKAEIWEHWQNILFRIIYILRHHSTPFLGRRQTVKERLIHTHNLTCLPERIFLASDLHGQSLLCGASLPHPEDYKQLVE